MQNKEPEKETANMAAVLAVLGHPELDKQTLSHMRLDRQEAYKYNRLADQLSDLSHRVVFGTLTNTVYCVSMTPDGRTPVPQPLLKRSDIRLLEKKLHMDALRHTYHKAQKRALEHGQPALENLDDNNDRLLYWAIKEGHLKTRADPHLTSAGAVLPMTHVVLLNAKSKTARSILNDASTSFSLALGPLIVFRARRRLKRDETNNMSMYLETFEKRVHALRRILGDVEAGATADTGADTGAATAMTVVDEAVEDEEDEEDGEDAVVMMEVPRPTEKRSRRDTSDDDYVDSVKSSKKSTKSTKHAKSKSKGKKEKKTARREKKSKRARPPAKTKSPERVIDTILSEVAVEQQEPVKKIKLTMTPTTPPLTVMTEDVPEEKHVADDNQQTEQKDPMAMAVETPVVPDISDIKTVTMSAVTPTPVLSLPILGTMPLKTPLNLGLLPTMDDFFANYQHRLSVV